MLTLQIDGVELFDNKNEVYVKTSPITVKLEHSLISLSRWEALWEIPFISNGQEDDKTIDQLKSYIECMIIGSIPDNAIELVWHHHGKDIEEYIAAPYSALKIYRPETKTKSKEPVTAEVIYYWMVKFNIPTEFNKWHLNRLLTLIDYFNAKENPQKMTQKEIFERNRHLNEKRMAAQRGVGNAKI